MNSELKERDKAMQCPKCQAAFEKVSFADAVAERCTNCQGIWLDNLEHELLKEYADSIDIGAESKGAEFNKIDRISCPVCPSSKLLRMVDSGQPHIWFESCPVCYGRFYDAGEFKDFASYTIGDFIKDLSPSPRD